MFDRRSQQWDPEGWGDLFVASGARYVVLTTKHHDGYCLWPTEASNPFEPAWSSTRDLTGELAAAVRSRGLRFGTYYSGGLDWSWLPATIRNQQQVFSTFPQSDAYIEYVDAHWRELISRYAPDILWNDIGTPANQDLRRLFADYFAAVPEGVINSRFGQRDDQGNLTQEVPCDMTTPEYAAETEIAEIPFETCRGIGHSFGFNREEGAASFDTTTELIHLLIDIVSTNGNLLLNVGPAADGSIEGAQQDRLREIGAWLRLYGEAIFGTRPWTIASLPDNEAVRFTSTGHALFVVVKDHRDGETIVLPEIRMNGGAVVTDLASGRPLVWQQHEDAVEVRGLPAGGAAAAFRIEPAPTLI
jgi:alpha-L-fucosidase